MFQAFRENLDSDLANFENLRLEGVRGEAPKASEFIKFFSKNQWKPSIL